MTPTAPASPKTPSGVAFVLETLNVTRDGHLLETAAEEPLGVLVPYAGATTVHYLAPK